MTHTRRAIFGIVHRTLPQPASDVRSAPPQPECYFACMPWPSVRKRFKTEAFTAVHLKLPGSKHAYSRKNSQA